MLNIQFMTEAQAITNKRGHKVYVPNYESLKANACCQEERDAIDRCKETFAKFSEGFTFSICYTHYGRIWDPYLKETKYGWSIYQRPWYQRYDEDKKCYVKDSKEDMVSCIAVEEFHLGGES